MESRKLPQSRGVAPVARGVDFLPSMSRRIPLLLALALTAPACSMQSKLIHRPTDASVDAAISAMWTSEIRRVARDGDWLLSRAYYATSDLIVLGTTGESLSHGSIYDATRESP